MHTVRVEVAFVRHEDAFVSSVSYAVLAQSMHGVAKKAAGVPF